MVWESETWSGHKVGWLWTYLENKVPTPPILRSPDRVVTSEFTVGAVPTEFFSPFLTSLGGGGLKPVYWLKIGRNHHQIRVLRPRNRG